MTILNRFNEKAEEFARLHGRKPISPTKPASVVYGPKELESTARRAVSGLGRFHSWEIRVTASGRVELLAKFYRMTSTGGPAIEPTVAAILSAPSMASVKASVAEMSK